MKLSKLPCIIVVSVFALLAARRAEAFANFSPYAATPNQQGVASSLNGVFLFGPPGSLGAALETLSLLPAAQQQQALNQLSPQGYASIFPGGTVPGAQVQTTSVFDRLARLRSDREDALAMDPLGAQKYGGVLLAEGMADTDVGLLSERTKKLGAWGTLTGDMGRQYGTPAGPGFSFNGEGATGGLDYRVNDALVVGVSGGFLGTHASLDQGLGTSVGQTYKYGGYASLAGGGFFVDGYFGGGIDSFMIRRQMPVFGLTAGSSPGAHDFDMKIGAGYDARTGRAVVTPFAWVTHDVMNVAGFNESGAGAFDLNVMPFTVKSTKVALGFMTRSAGDSKLKPYFSAAWQHECEPNTTLTSSFVGGGSAFATALAVPSQDAALIGLGTFANLSRNLSARLGYDGEFRSGYISNAVKAHLRLAF